MNQKMTIEYNKIYRVVYVDNYQSARPETYWCTNKQACIDYINKKYYKQYLTIEESAMSDIIIKC